MLEPSHHPPSLPSVSAPCIGRQITDGRPGFYRGSSVQRTRSVRTSSKYQDRLTHLRFCLLAVALLYPAIILKTIAQNSRKGVSFVQAYNDIIHKRGLAGLYDGMQPQLIKGFFKEGLTLMTKER